MKKIQVILAAVAIMAAGAGVFANARAAFAVTYFRAIDAQPNLTGARCGVQVTLPCTEASGTQCSDTYNTQLPGETEPTPKIYYISKTLVDNGTCIAVTRAN